MKKTLPDSCTLPGIAFSRESSFPILSNPQFTPNKFRFRSQRAAGDVLYWFQNFRL